MFSFVSIRSLPVMFLVFSAMDGCCSFVLRLVRVATGSFILVVSFDPTPSEPNRWFAF